MSDTKHASRLVLITAPFREQWIERVQQISPELRVERRPDAHITGVPDEILRQTEILYTTMILPTPEQAPALRWIQLFSAGADHLLTRPIYQSDVTITTASGVHAVNIAEYVFAMLLAWYHRLAHMFEWQREGRWPDDRIRESVFVADELRGKTIGIVGYGSIGREVARLAQAFGMRVLAMQRGSDHRDHGFVFPGVGDPEGSIPQRFYAPDQLHALLEESDVVVIAVPLTPQTKGMFDEAAFRAMKTSAVLVNIARGGVCDEPALLHALQEGWIAGALLDVFAQEPLPDDSPFFRQHNVIISPHISGLTTQYLERAATIFLENLRRYLRGEPLYNVVEKERGY
ncbi:MAG: D-2-hydroxyacid dehydrogenase [Ktedonobacteraceae bacterium]|nr:D-2-hydroxyacid dehydrogenase [Ktedonobacteraceae bacterium]